VPCHDPIQIPREVAAGECRLDPERLNPLEVGCGLHVLREPPERAAELTAGGDGPAERRATRGERRQVLVPEVQVEREVAGP